MSELPETKAPHVRGAEIGFVFQAYNLLPRSTAYKNVELPLVTHAFLFFASRRQRVLDALAEVGLPTARPICRQAVGKASSKRTADRASTRNRPQCRTSDEPPETSICKRDEVLAVLQRLTKAERPSCW